MALSARIAWMPYFYPRSPCGERPGCKAGHTRQKTISIHALLAESDRACPLWTTVSPRFLSTLSLRRATGRVHYGQRCHPDFYPRSPCGERRDNTGHSNRHWKISIHALLAESDAVFDGNRYKIKKFLSTLSLRRATPYSRPLLCSTRHFYPRSPCGERPYCGRKSFDLRINFYPRSPCGERPFSHPTFPRL